MAAKFFCSCDGASWTKRSQLECRGLVASRTYSTSPSRPRTCKAKGSESGREGRACPAGGADVSHGALLKHRPSSLRGVGHTLGRPCPPQTHARAVPVADVPVTHSCRGLSDASCVDGAFLVKVTYLRVNLNTYGSRLPSLRGKPCLRPVHPFSHRRCERRLVPRWGGGGAGATFSISPCPLSLPRPRSVPRETLPAQAVDPTPKRPSLHTCNQRMNAVPSVSPPLGLPGALGRGFTPWALVARSTQLPTGGSGGGAR